MATTGIYTLFRQDALPVAAVETKGSLVRGGIPEEHTKELQSQSGGVCCYLLGKQRGVSHGRDTRRSLGNDSVFLKPGIPLASAPSTVLVISTV